MTTVPQTTPAVLDRIARELPDHNALVTAEKTLTFAGLRDEVRRAAAAMIDHGVALGDRGVQLSALQALHAAHLEDVVEGGVEALLDLELVVDHVVVGELDVLEELVAVEREHAADEQRVALDARARAILQRHRAQARSSTTLCLRHFRLDRRPQSANIFSNWSNFWANLLSRQVPIAVTGFS